MGFAAILSAAGMASDIIGGLKGNKQKAVPTSQMRPMEDNLKDIDKLRAYLEQNTQYNARPTRRLTAPELEGDFAPIAVREIQNFYDQNYQREQQGQPAAQPAQAAVEPAQSFSPQDEVFIKQYETGMIPQKQYAMQYQDAIKRRESAGKVPIPMGGYVPSNQPSQPAPLSPQELEQLRKLLGAGNGNG